VPREARDLGGYELIAKLATGGMAEIFLARRRGSVTAATPKGELVVVKRILPHLAEDDHFVTMFRDEAKLASRLEHTNVCRVHTLGHAGGTWFIVMEYLHGVALSRVLTKLAKGRQFLDFRIAAALVVQACEGLHHAHELRDGDGHLLGLVHRDVSPPNIFVTADGDVKLLDFGIAKARGASSKTRTGTVKGKNAYMSPEQILGKPLDRRSDIFALGAVAYELLAVKRLFHRDSDFLTFKAITEEAIPDIRERRPDIPAALRSVLNRALARDPNGRFADCLEFAEAVKKAVSHLGGPVSKPDLGRFVRSDFGDELATKDALIHDVDVDLDAPTIQLNAGSTGPLAIAQTVVSTPRGRSKTTTEELDMIGGEIGGDDLDVIPRHESRPLPLQAAREPDRSPNRSPDRTPSMIVAGTPPRPPPLPAPPPTAIHRIPTPIRGSRAMVTSQPMPPVIAAQTVELGDPHTDLLGDRWKRLRNIALIGAIAIAVLVAVGIAISGRTPPAPGTNTGEAAAAAVPVDAAVAAPPPEAAPDAGGEPSRQDIIALSRFGFFSIDADAKTTIFIDGKRIGEAPLTRLPLPPGIHKIKAIGPRSKVQKFEITIYAAKDTDYGTLTW
jgi:serine/threonine protein kinase